MQSLITPLIVCGGSGTRLWPASRADRPKQFLPLFGPLSTFQETVRRVTNPERFSRPVIVTNRKLSRAVAEQLGEIAVEARILLEPEARDSGPAIAAGAAAIAAERGEDAPVLSLAADHLIRDVDAFQRDCGTALEGASAGKIVTFGIAPTHPAIEYGYIEPAEIVTGAVRGVRRFVEKPDRETAESYIGRGFVWNSGNFLFLAGVLLREYRNEDPATVEAIVQAVAEATDEAGSTLLDAAAFTHARKLSIDHAVLEKTAEAAMVRASFDWSDVGSWSAVRDLLSRDDEGNAVRGRAVVVDARNNMISTEGTPSALVGLEHVAVIATADAILVADCRDTAGIKALVEQLKAGNSDLV